MQSDDLELLAQLAGMPGAELSDEHIRWQLYSRVLPLPDAHDVLRRALLAEPVPTVASAVVVALFNHVPPADRASWVKVLPANLQAFPTQRMTELAILDRYQTRPHETAVPEIAPWSDWLQRKVASTTFAPDVLGRLAADGRTKRIRAIAARRLSAVRPAASANVVVTFRALAHAVLETADEAAGVEPLEPGLELALQVLRDNPDRRPQFEAALISLLSPVRPGAVELVSFLMHELRWDAVRAAIRNRLSSPGNVS